MRRGCRCFSNSWSSTPLLFRSALECICSRHRKLFLFAVSQRYFEQQTTRLPIQKRRSNGSYFITCFDHIGSPSDTLQHIDAGAFQCVMFDGSAAVFYIDVQIRMRIAPLPPRYRTFESQALRVIVHCERMMCLHCS